MSPGQQNHCYLLKRPELLSAQSSRSLGRSNVVIGAFMEAKDKSKFVIQAITFRVRPRDAFRRTLLSRREGNRLKGHAETLVGIPDIWGEEAAQIELKYIGVVTEENHGANLHKACLFQSGTARHECFKQRMGRQTSKALSTVSLVYRMSMRCIPSLRRYREGVSLSL